MGNLLAAKRSQEAPVAVSAVQPVLPAAEPQASPRSQEVPVAAPAVQPVPVAEPRVSPLARLKERLANGEVTLEEYERIRMALKEE